MTENVHSLVPLFKDFLEKGKEAMDSKDYYVALTNFNVAKKILTEIMKNGNPFEEQDFDLLKSMVLKANEAYERQVREKKEHADSQLTRLRVKARSKHTLSKKRKVISILLFGLDAAGKTSFVDYIKQEKFLEHSPTLGVNISNIILGLINFVFHDMGGQQIYRSKWRDYWMDTDFLIYTVDATDTERFDQARLFLWEVLQSRRASKIPLLVLSTKMDKHEARPLDEIIKALNLEAIKGRLYSAFDISVKTEKNINNVLNFLASHVLGIKEMRAFVDEEIARLDRNYSEIYKAYISEAKSLEKEHKYDPAIERVYKAKCIQEELFKQGFSKAQKKISICTTSLFRLNRLKVKNWSQFS